MLQTFSQVQIEEPESAQLAFGMGAAEVKEKEKEESQSWKAEDLLEFMNYPYDESDHPNVLTEEVTNDKRMLDQ